MGDITKQLELHSGQETLWNDSVGPKKSGEVSDESKALVGRMDTVKDALSALNTESETEAAKFEEEKHWKAESEAIKTVLDNGNASAQKMTTHGEADKQYAANVKRWEGVDKAIKEWITKMEALVKMWEDQAATADKVTNAISDPSASDMKLEDLEAHLNSLKEMFIQKQKMMDSMNPPTQA